MRPLFSLIALIVALWPAVALAHVVDSPIGPDQVWSAWRPEFLGVALPLLALILYGRGLMRLWRQTGPGHAVTFWQATSFLGGVIVLLVALASPLEAAAGALLSFHMLQHVLLIAVAPPLLIAGRPDAVFAWAMPKATVSMPALAWLAHAVRPLVRPIPAALLHGLAVWVWHAPALFDAAIHNDVLHELEHVTFVVTALFFWQSVVVAMRSPSLRLASAVAITITMIMGGFLGALLTLSGEPLYDGYAATAPLWGITVIEDQQLAGLVMWIPAGAIYLLAGLAVAARMLGPDVSRGRQSAESRP